MKIRLTLDLTDEQVEALVRVAVARSFLRKEPRREWARVEAVRFAAAALITEALQKRFP